MLIAAPVWNRGRIGDGGYSSRLSVRLGFEPRDCWVGVHWKSGVQERWVWVCLIPCVALRFHYRRSYGGTFPKRQRRPLGIWRAKGSLPWMAIKPGEPGQVLTEGGKWVDPPDGSWRSLDPMPLPRSDR